MLTPEDLWNRLALEGGEDRIAAAASVSASQAERDLRAAGFDAKAERERVILPRVPRTPQRPGACRRPAKFWSRAGYAQFVERRNRLHCWQCSRIHSGRGRERPRASTMFCVVAPPGVEGLRRRRSCRPRDGAVVQDGSTLQHTAGVRVGQVHRPRRPS
jgi:hypothetical protein